MSNQKSGEIPDHRKPKVSWAMLINPGLVGPKSIILTMEEQVNIPALP